MDIDSLEPYALECEKKCRRIEDEMAGLVQSTHSERYQLLTREYSAHKQFLDRWHKCRALRAQIEKTRELMNDSDQEVAELAKEEVNSLQEALEDVKSDIEGLLHPRDKNADIDSGNAILEIRAGTGGEEASLFARDILRMYTRFAEKKGWKVDVLSVRASSLGGYKEAIVSLEGDSAYGILKNESGVHRVQRIPATESGGRIHTSTVSVAILPEAKEVDVKIDPGDLRIDTYAASGPGGQHVNRTFSAVRITHIPTGMVVQCQDERSQYKNKAKAMTILRARLMHKALEEKNQLVASQRKQQIGSAKRSEKIRTYNFPQDRLTDHRSGINLHHLDKIMDGEIDTLVVRKQKNER